MIVEPQDLRLLYRSVERAPVHASCEVEQRAGDCGERDLSAGCDVLGIETTRRVDSDAAAAPGTLAASRDVDRSRRRRSQIPERGGGPVAEHGVVATRQHGGNEMPVAAEPTWWNYRIDACMESTPTSRPELMANGIDAARKEELSPADDKVLLRGKFRHELLDTRAIPVAKPAFIGLVSWGATNLGCYSAAFSCHPRSLAREA
jgi:hypothetical protein